MGAEGQLRVEIWAPTGQRIAVLSGEGLVTWQIPAALSNGVYLWQAEFAGQIYTGRVQVQR